MAEWERHKKGNEQLGAHFRRARGLMKEGKRPNSILSNADVDALCLHFWEVFVLWDGAFSLARTVGPMQQDLKLT
jgi:hypothetical protein